MTAMTAKKWLKPPALFSAMANRSHPVEIWSILTRAKIAHFAIYQDGVFSEPLVCPRKHLIGVREPALQHHAAVSSLPRGLFAEGRGDTRASN